MSTVRGWIGTLTLVLTLVLLSTGVAAAQTAAEEVRFESAGASLAGTLTLPEGPGPHPAVILLSGSGPQERNSAIPGIEGYRPFAEIAATLTEAGIAVLRYDDRGAGASTGDPFTATTADLADDARAALRYLQGRDDIDALQVGLVGHSEGGLIAPLLAARDPGVAFIVTLAPPVSDPVEGLVMQERRTLQAAGLPDAQVASGTALARRMLELNLAGDWNALESLLSETARAQLAAMPEERRAAFGDLDTAVAALIGPAMTQQRFWMHWFITHDPAPYWRALHVPALAVFGGRDVQVDAPLHRGALEAIVAGAGLEDVDVVTLPDANHLFQRARTGGLEEYGALSPTLMPELLDTLRGWLLQQVSLPSPS